MPTQNNHMADRDKIKQAFLQLSFATKLHFYVEDGKIDKNLFDRGISFTTLRTKLPANEFHSYEDIKTGAVNNLNITLRFSAIVLSDAFKAYKKTHSLSSEQNDLCDLIYMIRCCFAHNAIEPQWNITKSQFLRKMSINLNNCRVDIDLQAKNNTPFIMSDIGGHDAFLEMKDIVLELLTHDNF